MRLDGLLFFPLTPFDSAGEVAPDVLASHVANGVDAGVGGVFVACGTGEFHALGLPDFEQAVRGAVEAVDHRVPVVAGAGGALPHAIACAKAAERAGADGLLLMPPYLVNSTEAGLDAYVRQVADATDLSVVIYQRNNARFTPEGAARLAAHPKIVGFKDGLGDIEQVQRIVLTVREEAGEDFLFFNGLPTAEMSVAAYRAAGVRLYSSAAFAFVPEVAMAFYNALNNGDDKTVRKLLTDFYRPLTNLRDQVPGYAVSLVKAGARIRGLDAGGVRPPLTDPTPEHMSALEALIESGLAAVKE
ncbi:5-dehydro-4-deoxyglucarate dehydratase [Lipingzhangella halophila]|uniref:Probable 5-dehydro-4-deoxyglucarate dehydratase n=1 Tax=Lipingzhangella halophila TaxID=1783352 RepID=A0A7W7W6V9_9ACTN|nr:5-dehydro-4-deoxyglucarate dehydratase [Lipingzhangella halophila]MBB4935235.1 5-dehydro-4-deoxyglucarate dehydratase [Lipingzhangella halophila]